MTHGLVTKRSWVGSDRTTGKWRTYKIRRGKALTTWGQTPKGHAHLRKVMRRTYLSSELEAAQEKRQIYKNDSKTQTLWLISLWCSSYCLAQCRESCKHLKIPSGLFSMALSLPGTFRKGEECPYPVGFPKHRYHPDLWEDISWSSLHVSRLRVLWQAGRRPSAHDHSQG